MSINDLKLEDGMAAGMPPANIAKANLGAESTAAEFPHP
jgi:hypothetical protein